MRCRSVSRLAIRVLFALTIVGSGPSCSRPKGVGYPRVEVTPKIVDLGEIDVDEGTHGMGRFVLRNRGNAALQIFKWSTSCGCTIPDMVPADVAAGATVKIGGPRQAKE